MQNLKSIKILDLSDNSISNTNCFKGLDELVNLKLQGNMIKSLDALESLTSCNKLKNLHLQALSGDHQNPICELNNYRNNVLDHLNQITRLDGIPKGMVLNNGS